MANPNGPLISDGFVVADDVTVSTNNVALPCLDQDSCEFPVVTDRVANFEFFLSGVSVMELEHPHVVVTTVQTLVLADRGEDFELSFSPLDEPTAV